MPTYLTNSKMSPALRARIEASVRGGRGGARLRVTPQMRVGLRLLLILVVGGSVISLVLGWRQRQRALESAQSALLAEVVGVLAPLRAAGSDAWSASRALLAEEAAEYAGDRVDPTLRGAAELDTLLKRPTVYVRGPIAAFAGEATLEKAAAESVRDAFIHCLLVPPSSKTEKTLRPKVAAVYRGEPVSDDEAAPVHRLHDSFRVRWFLDDQWAELVMGARSAAEVDRLRARVNEAHLERAVQAAQAELLVYLMDEPKKPGTPSELDGASDHLVRVGIMELGSGNALLRQRKRVDPSWIAKAQRGYLARGLNACRLAIDVREALDDTTSDRKASQRATTVDGR